MIGAFGLFWKASEPIEQSTIYNQESSLAKATEAAHSHLNGTPSRGTTNEQVLDTHRLSHHMIDRTILLMKITGLWNLPDRITSI